MGRVGYDHFSLSGHGSRFTITEPYDCYKMAADGVREGDGF
jgi:hypothetical protein